MLYRKQNKQIAIGLIALALSMATFAMDEDLQDFFNIGRALQLMATVILCIGVFKKDAQHKDKFLLIWLVVSTFLLTTLCYVSLNYFTNFLYYYDYFTWLLCLLFLWAATAIVAFLVYYMYLEYEELKQSDSAATTNASGTQEINASWETKEQPPPYNNPTSENVSISIPN